MKKPCLSLMILGFLFVGSAYAEHPSNVKMRLGGGIAIPISPKAITQGWNSGINATGGFQFQPSYSPILGLEIDFTHSRFRIDKDHITGGLPGVSIEGGTFTVTYISSNIVINPMASSRSIAKIYLRLGAGVHFEQASPIAISGTGGSITIPGDSWAAKFGGFNVGLGLQFQKLFLEASYIIGIESDPTSHVPIIMGLVLDLGPGL